MIWTRLDDSSYVVQVLDCEDPQADEVVLSVFSSGLQWHVENAGGNVQIEEGEVSMLLPTLISKRLKHHPRLLEIVASAGATHSLSYIFSPRSRVAIDRLQTLPAMVQAAAAPANSEEIIKVLYAMKQPHEELAVGRIRALGGEALGCAAHQLLLLLEQWDRSVKAELEQERITARALFGLAPSLVVSKRPGARRPLRK